MWNKIKKGLAFSVNLIMLALLMTNVLIAFFKFNHFAIPSIAYAYTVVIMMIRYDSERYTSKRIDWYGKIDFGLPKWQFRMGKLFMLFIIISVIYFGLLYLLNW